MPADAVFSEDGEGGKQFCMHYCQKLDRVVCTGMGHIVPRTVWSLYGAFGSSFLFILYKKYMENYFGNSDQFVVCHRSFIVLWYLVL